MKLNRRLFLIGGTSTAAAASVAGTRVAAQPTSTAKLTPAEYVREMHAIGWEPIATLDSNSQPVHVIECGPSDPDGHLDYVRLHETQPAFAAIQRRVPNDPAFWPAVARILFDQGRREDTHPRSRSDWERRLAARRVQS